MNPYFRLSPGFFEQNKVDLVYVSSSEQLAEPLITRFTGIAETTYGFRFIHTANKTLLLSGALEYQTVRKQYSQPMKKMSSRKQVLQTLRKFFSKKRVGLNFSYLTAGQLHTLKKNFPSARFVDVSSPLYAGREIKTREEIKKIIEAAAISQEISKKIPSMVKRNMSELQLGAEIKYSLSKEGCEESFPTIVGFGKNSTDIHHFNGNKKLQKGENVLVDFGAKYQGYCADLSRTFCFGNVSADQLEWYQKCFDAQTKAMEMIKPGVHVRHLMEAAEKTLGRKIPHALGHGIGLEVHDVPGAIYSKAEWTLKENQCLAIEPGYYGPRFGIRIEDDVIVTKNGNKRISFAPKKMVEI